MNIIKHAFSLANYYVHMYILLTTSIMISAQLIEQLHMTMKLDGEEVYNRP